jgi:hypothetical protein
MAASNLLNDKVFSQIIKRSFFAGGRKKIILPPILFAPMYQSYGLRETQISG